MVQAIATYLESNGYENVFTDFQPDIQSIENIVAIFCWDKIAAPIHDGTATHMIQIRVRRGGETGYKDALDACTSIVELLDSGANETPIPLEHPGVTIGRLRRLPTLLERNENTHLVYAELAVYGQI